MTNTDRMLLAALEAGVKTLAQAMGPTIDRRVRQAMELASREFGSQAEVTPSVADVTEEQRLLQMRSDAWLAVHNLLVELAGGNYVTDSESAQDAALGLIRRSFRMAMRVERACDTVNDIRAIARKAIDFQTPNFSSDDALRQIIKECDVHDRVFTTDAWARQNGRSDSAAFKNFHRLLCERFGYVHDETDWRRDQLSLIEHIAKQVTSEGRREPVRIDYTNHKGERRLRTILPIRIWYGSTPHHQEEQWFVIAHDIEKDARRTFALASVHRWGAAAPVSVQEAATSKTVRYDLSALDTESELRAAVIARGWREPGAGVVEELRSWAYAYPRMDIYAKPGELVMFDGRGGYPSEQQRALEELKLRGVYEVEEVNIGQSRSTVKLRGHDGWFNTVMFSAPPALDVYRSSDPPNQYHVAGSPVITTKSLAAAAQGVSGYLHWRGKDDATYFISPGMATEYLKELHEHFPGGIDEFRAAMEHRTAAGLRAPASAANAIEPERPVFGAVDMPDGYSPAMMATAAAAVSPAAQPLPDGWIKWSGDPVRKHDCETEVTTWPSCPVPGAYVRLQLRRGIRLQTHEPEKFRWSWDREENGDQDADIVAYQVISPEVF